MLGVMAASWLTGGAAEKGKLVLLALNVVGFGGSSKRVATL
jgi:hypothetical protein